MAEKYTIQRGDTLWDLSRRLGVTVDDIMRLNPQVQNRDRIYAGAKLTLPPARAPRTGVQLDPASLSPGQPGGSSAESPLKALGVSIPGTPLEGLVSPSPLDALGTPQMVGAPMSGPQLDAVQASQGMSSTPELAVLGTGAMIPGILRGVPALAGMMPSALPRAGVLGNAVKGAVHYPGAAPSMSNVAPVLNPGAVRAMLAAQRAREAQAAGPSWSQILGDL